jgi:hypothetical protein
MLKTDSLPVNQELRNSALNRELGHLGIALILLGLLTAGGLFALYINGGNGGGSDHQVASKDGLLLGFAVVMSADYVLTDADVPEEIQINGPDHSVTPARKIRTQTLEENITFSLIRASTPFPAAQVPLLGSADVSQAAHVAISGARWEGVLKPRATGPYLDLDPPITLGPGLPLSQNQTLVAITAQTVGGVVVAVPTSILLTKFKELSSAQ